MALTDTKLRAIKSSGERSEYPDGNGLVLRVSAKGAKTWTISYRVRGTGATGGRRVDQLAGNKRRLTLGDYPTVGLSEARARAAEVKRLARAGVDAAEERRPATARTEPTVTELIDRYVADHLRRNELRVASNVEKQLRLHVAPAWGSRSVSSIQRADLLHLLEQIRLPRTVEAREGDRTVRRVRGGPGASAEVRKWCRAMFQFAVDMGLRHDNPLADVKNRDKQHRRERVLSMEELRTIWHAAAEMGYPWGPFYRLVLLTGDRRGEWARAQWTWLDEDTTRLEIPAEEYKTGKPQVVPLSRPARALVKSLEPGSSGPFLFSSDGGARPISGFSKAKARLDRLITARRGCPMAPWVIHDLRRSVATHMERIGIEPHIIEVCLGHALKGVAGIYRQYGYLPEKAAALQRWADELLPSSARDLPASTASDELSVQQST